VLAIVHSHPNASANPSMADRVGCERSGLPWLICGWPSGVIVELHPEHWQAPMEGREFHFGLLDCYTLIQDYFARMLHIELPDFDREYGFWQRTDTHEPEDLYGEGFPAAGFVEVQGEPREHDVLLMRLLRSEVDNHGAIYLGNTHILHHLIDQPSRQDVWGSAWRTRTTRVLRHGSLL
jgi:cell wall-associated NlpC family hydrolase